MVNRFGKWWPLWMTLIVLWTLVTITFGWMNMPRAQYMAHDPGYLNSLSDEALSILHWTDTAKKTARGTLVWSESPRVARMLNGADLTFPANTTAEQAAFVAREYRQILHDKAREKRWSFFVEMLAIWLAPCVCLLIVPSALSADADGVTSLRLRFFSQYVRQRTVKSAAKRDHQDNDGAIAA